jgi:L,D-transpeptidase catalytic domain
MTMVDRRARLLGPLVVGLLLAFFAGIIAPMNATASPQTVYVEQAGHTLDGLFLDMWRSYPTALGNPITEEIKTKGLEGFDKKTEYTVQYFEDGALIYVPEEAADWQVQGLFLGKDALKADRDRYPSMELPQKGSCEDLGSESCTVFENGYTVHLGFKDYWNANGGAQILGLPITEELKTPDGYTTQYFERSVLRWKKDADVAPRSLGKEITKRLRIKTDKIDQPLDIPIYDESLFLSIGGDLGPGPGPQQGGYKEIVVSKSQSAMWAYEDGNVVISSLVSVGTGEVPEVETPVGFFSVLTKYEKQTMEGTINAEDYKVEDVPDVLYFDNLGNALHGTYWHDNFGFPMSHGCVNLPLDVAAWLYDWAPVGTAVTVLP